MIPNNLKRSARTSHASGLFRRSATELRGRRCSESAPDGIRTRDLRLLKGLYAHAVGYGPSASSHSIYQSIKGTTRRTSRKSVVGFTEGFAPSLSFPKAALYL